MTVIESLKNSKVVLFGAGVNGKQICMTLMYHGVVPAYFVDNKHSDIEVGENSEEYPSIMTPEVLLSEEKHNIKIIITPNFPLSAEIESQLNDMGMDECIFRITIDFASLLLAEAVRKIPKTVLEKKHFKNLRYVANRQELLSLLPKSCVCAELGVHLGDFAKDICMITNPKKLHLIDMWGTYDEFDEKRLDSIKTTFSSQIESGVVQINRGKSINVLETFADGYFDWVYIDTDHSYETTKCELELCNRKVKANGIIAGHDFDIFHLDTGVKLGVVEAVYEFCKKEEWELLYKSADMYAPSFAIRRRIS